MASIGTYLAKKSNKIRINGGNSMPLTEKDMVLTTEEAIEYLKISKPTFLKYIRLGRIKATKAGKGWRILLSELNRFLKGEMS
jgi:excisionase family DNA binding protein